MKKFILFILLNIIFCMPTFCQVFRGKTVEAFSTENPKVLNIKAVSELILQDGTIIEKGSIIQGEMINITEPQKWCKNASFSLKLISYNTKTGELHELSGNDIIRYRQKMKADFENSEIDFGMNSGWSFMLSPRMFTRIKDSSSPTDYFKRSITETLPWRNGDQIEMKANETIYFNY